MIEKFGCCAVVEFKQDIRSHLDEITQALLNCFPFELIVAKGHQTLGLKLKERVFCLHGELPQSPVFSEEFGIKYSLSPSAPHNSGLYLDARPARKWLTHNSRDRRVLNLFAFTGSLGIAALKGGARAVTHLDKSAELLPRIQSSYRANALDFDQRCFLRGDIYKHLPRAIRHGQHFEGIILDPPPKVFASRYAKQKPQGQDIYQLVKLCSKLLVQGGWLLTMFHRFDSTWDQEEQRVSQASDDSLQAFERFTSDLDFPEDDPNSKLRVSAFIKA